MRSIAPSGFGLAAAIAVAAFAFAPAAQAIECEGMQRSFTGELQKVKGKTIVVDNKQGDKIKFTQPAEPMVGGEKSSWDDLKKGDMVSVCSKMLEKPRYAYKVEVLPEQVGDIVAVMATGRSDYPNQINNVLAFPGIFRGALDTRASDINDAMKRAAAEAIATVVSDDSLSSDYIIPSLFNREVGPRVAAAVARAAHRTGVARRSPKSDEDEA